MKGSLTQFVHACYSLDGNLHDWVRQLAEAAPIESEAGWVAHVFRVTPDEFSMEALHVVGDDPMQIIESAAAANGAAPELGLRLRMNASPTLATVSERTGLPHGDYPQLFSDATAGRVRDIWGLTCLDGTESGAGIFYLMPEARETTASERRMWSMLAAHVTAGLRLRRRLDLVEEAVLTPEGEVVHAEGAAIGARAALQHAVRTMEGSSGARSGRRDVLEGWLGLIEGRWSLVHRFEADGRRFLVAHPNEPDHGDPRGLSHRERQVAELVGLGRSNKEIAYSLGVSQALVSARARAAIKKLDLGGLSELASFFAPGAFRERVSRLRMDEASEPLWVLSSAGYDERTLEPLTDAERHIALALLRGATNRHIAAQRGTSPSTVANQIQGILSKLGVGSRVELAAYVGRTHAR